VQGRVDDSDVLQETFLDVSRRLSEYIVDPKLPFYLWLRHMTGLKLAEVHRRHLGTQLRDADREVLALKHFEQLTTSEIAQMLGMSKAGAGSRYLRAIKRLKDIMSQIPGIADL
jgi:RNA polymerase sigma-70 factor (ECF subfamily)